MKRDIKIIKNTLIQTKDEHANLPSGSGEHVENLQSLQTDQGIADPKSLPRAVSAQLN